MSPENVRENLLKIKERIATAAKKAARRTDEITLIAVSKTQPGEAIRAAYEAGVREFGENRVQEWEGKRREVEDLSATWHLIGHLQSNKAAKAVGLFHTVDSVDDLALAERLNRVRGETGGGEKLRVLLEVKVGEEASKSGAAIEELPRLAEGAMLLPHLELAGLMCIPPFFENAEDARPYFLRVRTLRDDLAGRTGRPLPVLSMGMSHDFEVAVEEGATEVRIGTALFGARPTARV